MIGVAGGWSCLNQLEGAPLKLCLGGDLDVHAPGTIHGENIAAPKFFHSSLVTSDLVPTIEVARSWSRP